MMERESLELLYRSTKVETFAFIVRGYRITSSVTHSPRLITRAGSASCRFPAP